MLTSVLLVLGLAGAPPAVVGADRPLATKSWVSERGDPDSAGDTTAICRAYRDFAVVVFDAPLTKGTEGVEIRDRAGGMKNQALCAKEFSETARILAAGDNVERGTFFAVKGPVVLLGGADGFGAHERLALYRAFDGALLLDTTRFEEGAVRLSLGKGTAADGEKDAVEMALRLALRVGCDPRIVPVDECLGHIKRDNGVADDVILKLDVKRACRAVSADANLQLGVDAVITVDGEGARTRVIGGDLVCFDEP
jgi:hypothetical protein